MKIQQSLVTLDDQARASQRLAIRAIAAVIVCYLFGLMFNMAEQWSVAVSQSVAIVWTICSWAALVTAAVAVTRYWTIHRPRLEKGRYDLHVAMFEELQRQIAELRSDKQAASR